MPNGRSGGFTLKLVELELLLKQHGEETVVGRRLNQPVTTAGMLLDLKEWSRGDLFVEEQDGSWYIVHFQVWVTVNEKSPLFPGLRQAHETFLANLHKDQGQGQEPH